MATRDELLSDVLAAPAPDDPAAEELVAYARQALALAPDTRDRVERWLAASPAHRDRFRAIAPSDWTLSGSCLCGGVRYELRGPVTAIAHCHCRVCRKAHGAAFGTFTAALADGFRWTAGEELLTRFETSPGRSRAFCSRCGSTLTGAAPGGYVAVSLATLDVDPASRPSFHANFHQRVAWLESFDDLGQLEGTWD